MKSQLIPDPQANIQAALAEIFDRSGVRFSLFGEPMAAVEVFSEAGFLPHLTLFADATLQAIAGWGGGRIPASYEESPDGLLGLRVTLGGPLHFMVPAALLCAAETVFLSERLTLTAMTPDAVRRDVSLDKPYEYWRNLQTEKDPPGECPWQYRVPL